MIELRWAVKMPKNPRVGPVTRLQYRQLEQQLNVAREEYYMGWSKWKDVPTVNIPRAPT